MEDPSGLEGGGVDVSAENAAAGLEEEEDFDAFNDDTFGVAAAEWEEGAHERLAQLTEEERLALKQSSDFFGLGDDEEDRSGEALEKPTNGELMESARRQLQEGLLLNAKVEKTSPDDPAIVDVGRRGHPELPQFAAADQFSRPPQQQQEFRDPAIMTVVSSAAPQMPMMPQPPPHILQQQSLMVAAAAGRPPGGAGGLFPMTGPPPPPAAVMHFHGPPPPRIGPPMPPMPLPGHPPPPNMMGLRPGMVHRPLPPMSAQQAHPQQIYLQQQQQQQHQQRQARPAYQKTAQEVELEMLRQQQFQQHRQHQLGHHHYQHRYHGRFDDRHHQHRRESYRSSDDKNRETFGDDFVDSVEAEKRANNRRFSHEDDRELMTPGHVHALGILRGARERRQQRQQQPQSTGNPQLDLEMERRELHDEGWQEEYYSRSANDPYAGLMTPRERQWIINIQMQQLKWENPFVDDYYFTVYNQEKEAKHKDKDEDEEDGREFRQLKRSEEGPQLLLQQATAELSGVDGGLGKDEYKPVQFSNSLGKLQAVTVKAPRKIIDVGVVNNELNDVTNAQKESRNYKSTLLEIERIYQILIEVEDCEKKLAALPTNTAMREQVEEEQSQALARLDASLTAENRIRRYLMVRKGKVLLRRCLRLLDEQTSHLFCSTLFQLFPLATRKDREDKLLTAFWPDVRRHLKKASFGLLLHYLGFLNVGATQSSSGSSKQMYSTFKAVLGHPLGLAVLLLLLKRLGDVYSIVASEEQIDAETLVGDVWRAVDSGAELASAELISPSDKFEVSAKALRGEGYKRLQIHLQEQQIQLAG